MVASTVAHLASEQMLRHLGSNVAICLVDLHAVLEFLNNLLCEAYLLLWHQLVGQALGLRTLSPLLCLRPDDLLSGNCSLRGSHGALLLLTSHGTLIFLVDIHEVIRVDGPIPSTLPTSRLHLRRIQAIILDGHLSIIRVRSKHRTRLPILGTLEVTNPTDALGARPDTFFIDIEADGLEVADRILNIGLLLRMDVLALQLVTVFEDSFLAPDFGERALQILHVDAI